MVAYHNACFKEQKTDILIYKYIVMIAQKVYSGNSIYRYWNGANSNNSLIYGRME